MIYKLILSILFCCFFGSSGLRAECTGAADCHSCSSCRSCRHCAKEGGTCGVKDALEGNAVVTTPQPTTLPPQERLQPTEQPVSRINHGQSPIYETALLSLSNPAKLATLGDRGGNPRLKKIVYWLDEARRAGQVPDQIIDEILKTNGYRPEHAALIKTNLLRNMKIGEELGFFTPDNLELLRRGSAPIVMNGPYAGEKAEVDHVIPFSVAPEIGNDLANLELLPMTVNRRKSAKVGQRQKALARDLNTAGAINGAILQRILDGRSSE